MSSCLFGGSRPPRALLDEPSRPAFEALCNQNTLEETCALDVFREARKTAPEAGAVPNHLHCL